MVPVLLTAYAITCAVLETQLFRSVLKSRDILWSTSKQLSNQIAINPPRIVCGMTLIPADPTVDPQIRVLVPSTPDHKIQVIRPGICVD